MKYDEEDETPESGDSDGDYIPPSDADDDNGDNGEQEDNVREED